MLLSGSPSAAAGTNIAISAAAAASGSLRHACEGRVDWRVVAWMAPPSMAGAALGGLLAGALPQRLLLGAIVAVIGWSGLDLLHRPFRARPRARPRPAPAVVLGFLIGLLGGAVGVILGTSRVPALLAAVGLPGPRVVGTNLVVGVSSA